MLSFIEMGFYLSLALMICLIFLLMNHLKNRIVVLEKQNEGMMDVIKMIRGNLVSFDHEQKETKKSVYSLAKNISYVSSLVTEIKTVTSVKDKNIGLEVEDLYQNSNQINIDEEDEDEDDEDEDEEDEDPELNKREELEVVNIDIDWKVDADSQYEGINWPINDLIEIHKLSSNENLTEIEQMSESEFKTYFMETHSPIFMNSTETTDLQKLFFMMSMGNGVPMSIPSSVIFQNTQEYEILPSPSNEEDPDVEELPDSPMPELIPIDSNDDEEEFYKIIEQKVDEIQIQTRIDELIDEVITVPVVDISEDFVFTETEQPEIIYIKSEPEHIPEPEPEPERIPEPEPEFKEEKEAKTETVDFSKMDLKTLRSLVTTQEKVTHEKAAKMKKGDLIRILSSSV